MWSGAALTIGGSLLAAVGTFIGSVSVGYCKGGSYCAAADAAAVMTVMGFVLPLVGVPLWIFGAYGKSAEELVADQEAATVSVAPSFARDIDGNVGPGLGLGVSW